MDQDNTNTEQLQQETETDQVQLQQGQQEGYNPNEEQRNTFKINNDCGLMPEFKSADYTNLDSIKETFAPLRNINDPNFTIPHKESAVFLKLSSANKDNLHKAAKYGIWTSVIGQNIEIEKIFQQQQTNNNMHIYIYFFQNNSLFGMAELKSGYNPTKSFQLWHDEMKWFGVFNLEWIFVGKVEVDNQDIKTYQVQKQIQLSQEIGFKLLEYAVKSDFTTVFNDFDGYDQKEKDLREKREQKESEYYQNFCQKHSEFEHRYAKGQIFEKKGNRYYQNNYQHKNNQGYHHNQNNQYHHYHNNNTMGNPNYKKQYIDYKQQQQQQQQMYNMLPYLDQTQFQKFIESQPRIHINYGYQGFKKPYKNYNNQQNNGNYNKQYPKNYKYQHQNKQYNNATTDQAASQSPSVENQETATIDQVQQVDQNVQQQQQHQQKYYHNNNNYYKNNGQYYQNHNNNGGEQQVGNYQQHKPYYNKYNNNNHQNYNNNGGNNFNGNNNYNKYNNRNFKQYNNQNRQHRQNQGQFQGFQGNQNDFPHLGQLTTDNNLIQQQQELKDQHQTDQAIVEQQLDAMTITNQQ